MAIAIITKYVGPTNTRGAKIVAQSMVKHHSTGKVERVSIPFAFDGDNGHKNAARKLAEQLGWNGSWVAGSTQDGFVFVRAFEGELAFMVDFKIA